MYPIRFGKASKRLNPKGDTIIELQKRENNKMFESKVWK